MMLRILMFVTMFNFVHPYTVLSQKVPVTIEKLSQLTSPVSAVHKYVNFDVIRLFVGNGWSTGTYKSSGVGPAIDFQVLWPYSFLKNNSFFHVVAGLSVGYSSINWHHLQPQLTGQTLNNFIVSPNIDNTAQKTGYIGIPVFLLVQTGRYKKIDIMFGPSLHVNLLGSKLVIRSDNDKNVIHSLHNINTLSIPLVLQTSYRIRTCSLGFQYSYDLVPRFKNKNLKSIRQQILGVTLAVKI